MPKSAASDRNALVALWSADIKAIRSTFISTAIFTNACMIYKGLNFLIIKATRYIITLRTLRLNSGGIYRRRYKNFE